MSLDGLACVGVDGTPVKWTWQGTDVDESGVTTAYDTVNVQAFEATQRALGSYESRGFTLHDASRVVLYRSEPRDAKPTYSAVLYLSLQRGILVLRVGVDLGRADNVGALIASRGDAIEGGYVTSGEDRIPGGHGQRNAVEAKARELYELAQDVRDVATHVEVRYATRGGKHGRMDKTACSSFKFEDFT
jgi:hypothetical protein